MDSRKSGLVAADVKRLTLKKTNGTEPLYVGCYGFLNREFATSGVTCVRMKRVEVRFSSLELQIV